jgi:hypothetical protein
VVSGAGQRPPVNMVNIEHRLGENTTQLFFDKQILFKSFHYSLGSGFQP